MLVKMSLQYSIVYPQKIAEWLRKSTKVLDEQLEHKLNSTELYL